MMCAVRVRTKLSATLRLKAERVGGVELSEREWLTAENMGDDYWLYIVTNALSNPELYILQNPTRKLDLEAIVKRTRYLITQENWIASSKASH